MYTNIQLQGYAFFSPRSSKLHNDDLGAELNSVCATSPTALIPWKRGSVHRPKQLIAGDLDLGATAEPVFDFASVAVILLLDVSGIDAALGYAGVGNHSDRGARNRLRGDRFDDLFELIIAPVSA